MSAPATRRAALGAILAAPAAISPALAAPTFAALQPTISPVLARLIRNGDRLRRQLDEHVQRDEFPQDLIRGGCRTRAKVCAFPSRSIADTKAKLEFVRRHDAEEDFRCEVNREVGRREATLNGMALNIVLELFQHVDAGQL